MRRSGSSPRNRTLVFRRRNLFDRVALFARNATRDCCLELAQRSNHISTTNPDVVFRWNGPSWSKGLDQLLQIVHRWLPGHTRGGFIMKRREFVQSVTALAAGGVLSSQVAPSTANAAASTNAAAAPNSEPVTSAVGAAINPDDRGRGLKKPPVGPKLTVKQLEERTGLTASD